MEAAEVASASLGPRYAPEDPTLPKPWKGLMDGSTGVLYYWNPETNVTQYEKPASLPPPLPLVQPHPASTPKLAPIPAPHSFQQNTASTHYGQATAQVPQPQGQQVSQHGHQMPQQQSSQLGQAMMPQHGQVQQLGQPNAQQTQQHVFQPMPPRSGQQGPPQQAIHQMPAQVPGQQAYQNQGSQLAPMHQQMQYPPYQQSVFPQGQQSLQQYAQHGVQVQQPFANQQDSKPVFPKKEEDSYQNVNQMGFSPSQFHQPGVPAVQNQNQNLPMGTNSAQMHSGQPQKYSGSLNTMQQPTAMGQLQLNGPDLVHNPNSSRFQNERDTSVIHNLQPDMPPSGLRTGLENNFHGRGGNDSTFSSNQEAPVGSPQQPKLAAIPATRSHQGTRFSGVPYSNATPGQASALNNGAGYTLNNMHGHATGVPPFSNIAMARPQYFGSQDVSGFSSVESYRQQHEVTATGDNVPAPFVTFESTGFPPEILREMYSAGFSSPTPIQAQTWPIALQSKDIVAIAKTGSGKTLGYLIPAFILLRQRHNNPQNGPTVLVLAPTRELATQIQDEVIKFGRSSRVSCVCLYGGAPKVNQLKELDRGADVVVATPGRLNDILEMKKIDFWQVSLLVLDEADRMLDMGFEPQIRKIVNEIPPHRQTLMFTATWPKEVRKIAGDLLVNPVQVNIGNADELSANKAITQYVEVVPPMEKQRRLEQILRSQERGSKVIIFCSTKRLCDQLARSIGRNFGAAVIHGDKSQGERDWVLNQFRSGKSPVLVATDVAARGLGIKDIRVVINYDFPTGIEDYVHRIGRTGRAGATGMSYTFFSEQDWKYAADLIKVMEGANQRVPQEVREIAMRGGPGFGKDRRFDSGSRFGGRGGMRDGNFGGRGGMRDGGFSSRGGPIDGPTSGYVGRGSFFGADGGNRGRGFGGPDAGRGGFGRNDRMVHNRYNNMDGRGGHMDGRGRGRGRGRFDNRRDSGRGRDRSYSRSPEKVRTWGYSRSQSRSRSRSRSRSWSRSRSRSYSRSPRRSRSRSHSHNRSLSRSYNRHISPKQISEQKDPPAPEIPDHEARPQMGPTPSAQETRGNASQETQLVDPAPVVQNTKSEIPEVVGDPVNNLPII